MTSAQTKYYRWAVLRQVPLALTIAGLGSAVTISAVEFLPNRYSASTQLLVETATLSKDARKPTEELAITAELQGIEARLMTNAQLEVLRVEIGSDTAANDIRDRIQFETMSGRGKATTMEITVTDTDATRAADAANILAARVVEEHRAIKATEIDETLQFYRQEVSRTKTLVDQAFSQLLDFKSTNAGALPEDRQRYVDQRRAILLQQTAPTRNVTPNPVRSRLEAELKAAKSLYAAQHPRVRALTAQLAQADPAGAEGTTAIQPAQNNLKEIDGLLAQIPTNALRLDALQKTHDLSQSQYEKALARLEAASTQERIAQRARADRITIVEAAIPPALPTGPRRKIVLSGGIALSVILAILACIVRNRADPVLRRAEDLKHRLLITPYAVIPAK